MSIAPPQFTDDQLGFIQQVLTMVDPTGKMHPLTGQIQEAIQVYARAQVAAQQPSPPGAWMPVVAEADVRANRKARRKKK